MSLTGLGADQVDHGVSSALERFYAVNPGSHSPLVSICPRSNVAATHQLVEAISGTCITISYRVLGYRTPHLSTSAFRSEIPDFCVRAPMFRSPYRDATLIGIGKSQPVAGGSAIYDFNQQRASVARHFNCF